MSSTALSNPNTAFLNSLLEGDCRDVMKTLPPDYFSACITDPPYNYEFIGRDWNTDEVNRRLERVKSSSTMVKNIPYGSGLAGGVRNPRWYEKSRNNIVEYREWCEQWAREVFRIVRPGAFVLVFNSTRTIAHVQIALEEAGFYSRDILVYRRHAGIPKGLNAAKKLASLGDEEAQKWEGWHSCLRNEWEAICMVQKPLIGDYISTVKKYQVGLLNTSNTGEGFMSNILENVSRQPSDKIDGHCTVKPLELMKRLVDLVVPKGSNHSVIDPFCGTGTTCLAAAEFGHDYVGIDINETYLNVAKQRLGGKSDDECMSRTCTDSSHNMELFA